MRVVIVDDEPVARRGLRQLLAAHDDVTIAGEARNGREAVRVLSELAPDLVLLDVQMPGGDAFDVLRQLTEPLPAVILITAYDSYAVQAFEMHALDYLVKPVAEDRFRAAIERARAGLRTARALDLSRRLARLLDASGPLLPGPESSTRLLIPGSSGNVVLNANDIRWIEADAYYAVVYAHGRRHLLRESLDSLERRLDPNRFVRVHRSAIINLACVVALTGDRSKLELDDGTLVPLSRRRRAVLEDALRRFAVRHDI